jgi:hypothetical protein
LFVAWVVVVVVGRARKFFVRPQKILSEMERSFSSLFRFLLRKKPLSFVFVKDKKYTDIRSRVFYHNSFSLSLFPSFLEFTEKEMGKTSVKPKRQTVASEDARENERQGHRHRRRG